MTCVYRYIDPADMIIKYVGIVYSDNRTLKHRVQQHAREKKFQGVEWIIEYIKEDIQTRTDAEYFEAHYIALYGTDKYLNDSKQGWGKSNYLPNRENDWKRYDPSDFCDNPWAPTQHNPSDIERISINIFNEIMAKSSYKDRRAVVQGLVATNCRYENKERNEKIRQQLDRLLNKYLFQNKHNVAHFNGFADIEITLPLIGRVKYRDYDHSFIFVDCKKEVDEADILSAIQESFNECKSILVEALEATA